MRTLITGAGGFVAGHLAPLLVKNGHEVWGTVLHGESAPAFPVLECDIRDARSVQRAVRDTRPDYVVHLAAQSRSGLSWSEPALTYEVNVLGTLRLLEALRECGSLRKVLFVGSGEVYGDVAPSDCPLSERSPICPASPYAVSKACAELLAHEAFLSYGMPVVTVRPFNHTGPGHPPHFVLSSWARQAARITMGLQDPLITVGNVEVIRDFTDVRDIAKAYVLLLTAAEPGDLFVAGRGMGHPLSDYLQVLCGLCPVPVEVRVDPSLLRKKDIERLVCDPRKIARAVGWRAEIPMDQTLRDVYEYWQQVESACSG